MKRIIALAIIALLAWQAHERYEREPDMTTSSLVLQQVDHGQTSPPKSIERLSGFQCDGRTYCSQMTSCEEAHFFLAHCPDTKMDGDGDGIPCEQQWCAR